MSTPIRFTPLTAPQGSAPNNTSHSPNNSFKTVFDNVAKEIEKTNTSTTISGGSHLVGTISKEHPTVSDLLLNHGELREEGWNIIHAQINKNKPYTHIPSGTPIYYNPKNRELTWIAETGSTTRSPNHLPQRQPILPSPQSPSNPSVEQKEINQTVRPLSLGKLSSEMPTVSHLLDASSEFTHQKWDLLATQVNTGKSFDRIPTGTEIYIDRQTGELSWQGIAEPAQDYTPWVKSSAHLQDLDEAVQPYMGKPYEEINCYDLLVRGLRKLGIPYMGKDGLRNTLTRMATDKGLPENAFLNGEGIVEATGRKVLSHSYLSVTNWEHEALKIFDEMQNHLQKGQILSFSTPTRGHTGIVSQHNDEWTFINSGRMDHPVTNSTRSQEVGEETLLSEIENWFKIAKKNKESLLVTLGQLEEGKIRSATFGKMAGPLRL